MIPYFDIVAVLTNLLSEHFKRKPKVRLLVLIVSITILIISAAIILYYSGYLKYEFPVFATAFLVVIVVISLVLLFTALLSYTSFKIEKLSIFDIELTKIYNERAEIEKKVFEDKNTDIFSTIQLSLNHINEYYTINKGQAKKSFTLSVFAIVLGLLTIVLGIWLYYFTIEPRFEISVLTTTAGVLVEFIGGAYFYMYNKSTKQLNFFYEKLVMMQDTMLAIKLSEGVQDDRKKLN